MAVEIINRLRELGLPVFVIETTKIGEIPDLFKRLGRITGNEAQSIQAASEFSDKLGKLQSLYVDKKKVKTFYQIWDDPIMTLSGKHLVSDVIELCCRCQRVCRGSTFSSSGQYRGNYECRP